MTIGRWPLAVALMLACSACMATAEFRPAKGYKEKGQLVDMASRVKDASELSTCAESIGVIHASAPQDEDVIETFAKKAAAVGGTHYVIHNDAAEDEDSTTKGFGGSSVTKHGKGERRVSGEVFREDCGHGADP